MDHQHAMNRLRSQQLLNAALDYALFDRTHTDHFHNPFEIDHALANRGAIIAEIIQELQNPANYIARRAFAYFPPKSELCDRRLIYIPLKDLVVRYGIAILFAEQLEGAIHPQCFANRRATGTQAHARFTEDFATGGWARFCAWQEEMCGENTVLLRADISSFYDSISHEYLIRAVCAHLVLPEECELIRLLRTLLRVPVIYYSPSSGAIEMPAVMHQGLPIGDGVEGYLANIYLKELDDAMAAAGAPYGRYVDDIRLFGTSRQDVIQHLRILQEQLLRKGLNLNSSKTKIAEDADAQEAMISELYFGSDYDEEENEQAGEEIAEHIDPPLSAFSRTFSQDTVLEGCSDGKEFCKFLGGHLPNGQPFVPLSQRRRWHVERLNQIITFWRGPNKHAAWLLVQTATYSGVPVPARRLARQFVLEILEDSTVSSYSRYRILHHLIKLRRRQNGEYFRFVDQMNAAAQQRILDLVPEYLAAPAFELNLIGLQTRRIYGSSTAELHALAAASCQDGCEPVINALAMLSEIPATFPPAVAEADEPDDVPEVNS